MNERGKMQNSQPVLLVIRLSALGDVAMTIPAVYSLAAQYPEWTVKVLTLQPFANLFIGKPANIKIITVTKQDIKGLSGLLRLLHLLLKEPVNKVADLHNVLRSRVIDIFFRLKGIPVAVLDKGRGDRRALVKQNIGQQLIPYTERYFQVFRALGFTVEPTFTNVMDGDTILHNGSSVISRTNFSVMADEGKINIGIAPFARYKNKTYPLKQMEQLVGLLSANGNFNMLLFSGGREERTLTELWQQKYQRCHSVGGHLTLDDEIRLMSRLQLMVSMDSANMHLASLAGTRVISLWGSTTPQCGFLGWQQHPDDALMLHCDCQPCTIAGSNHCHYHDYHCLADITPDSIYHHIVTITTPTSHA